MVENKIITKEQITAIAKLRKMDLAARFENTENKKAMIIFGSIKLTYDTNKHHYTLHRLKQMSLNESTWVSLSTKTKNRLLSALRFYYIKGHNINDKIEMFHTTAFRFLFCDLQKITNQPITSETENHIIGQFMGGLWSKGWDRAGKAIGKFLRETVTPDKMRLYRKMFPLISFSEISVFGYASFLKKYKSINGDCGSLYPLIPMLYDGTECDGSNDWFIQRMKGSVSRGDIKTLRVAPFSLMRYYDDSGLLLNLLRHPNIKQYPIPILNRILGGLRENYHLANHPRDTRIMGLLNKWLFHHRLIWKEHGYKRYRGEWQQLTTQLEHAFDWLMAESPTIHKNQTWTAILRKITVWRPERNAHCYAHKFKWNSIIEAPVNLKGVLFSELVTSEDLFNEGDEMHHCVYSYSSRCHAGSYRVFRVESEKERATAGVRVKDGKLYLDQIYSTCNSPVSNELMLCAKNFVSFTLNTN